MHYTANGEFKNNNFLQNSNLSTNINNVDLTYENNLTHANYNDSLQTNNVNSNNQIDTTFTHNGVIYIVGKDGKDGKDFDETLYKKDICTYLNSLNNIDLIKNNNIVLPSFCINNTTETIVPFSSSIQPSSLIQPSTDISEFNQNSTNINETDHINETEHINM